MSVHPKVENVENIYFVIMSFQDFKLSIAGLEPKGEQRSSQQRIGRLAKKFVVSLVP